MNHLEKHPLLVVNDNHQTIRSLKTLYLKVNLRVRGAVMSSCGKKCFILILTQEEIAEKLFLCSSLRCLNCCTAPGGQVCLVSLVEVAGCWPFLRPGPL